MYQLYYGDCLVEMQKIPNKSIDMILCDLPYGTTKNKWDCIIPLDKLWIQYKRVIKDNGAIVLFAQTPFDKVLGYSNLQMLKYEWIWQKENGTGFLNSKKMPLKNHENILVFYKKLPCYNPQMRTGFKPYKCKQGSGSSNWNYNEEQSGHITENNGERFPIDVLQFNRESGFHPTQKPVELCEYLIKTYTNEGETVLDNAMGSCSTGVACLNTNRNFIGIEKEKHYFDISVERMKKHNESLKVSNRIPDRVTSENEPILG